MPNDMMVFNTLTTDETRLVQAMRRSARHSISVVSDYDDEPTIARVVVQLKRIINMLWLDDPYVVDLRPFHDPQPSLFELQFLYLLSEIRAQNTHTVEELLSWWFSPNGQAEAQNKLIFVANLLDENGFAEQSSDRLRAHMLATTSSRIKSNRKVQLDSEIVTLNQARRSAITLH